MKRTSLLVCVALILSAGRAHAQNEAAAEALFDRGLADLQAGNYESGCPAIEESHRLDPRPGSLFTLATCYAKAGKVASASARYTDYLKLFETLTTSQKAAQKGREKAAAEAKAELAPQIPLLTITLAAGSPRETIVKRDGIGLGPASLNMPLPIDPGEHVVTAEGSGGLRKEFRVTIGTGERKTLAIELAPAQPPLAAEPAKTETPSAVPFKTVAYVAMAVGGAGLAISAMTGIMAISKKGDVDANCLDHSCNSVGKAAADTGQALAAASTISFGVGISTLGAGVLLFVLQPKRAKQPPTAGTTPSFHVSRRGPALGLEGEF